MAPRLPFPSGFRRDRRATSAIEFAVAAPLFLLLLLAGVDTIRYVVATRRVEAVAATIGQMISVNANGQISPSTLRFYQDSAMVIFPQVLADSKQQNISWSSDIGITVSSIGFVNVAGIYVGKTVWSVGTNRRACLQPMIAVSNTSLPSPTTLPQDAFGPGSIITVDVTFNFRPTLAGSLLSAVAIARSFYIQPRYVTSILYTGAAGYNVSVC